MNDDNWKKELKLWKPNLKPLEIKLLEEGAQSNSQALMLCDMWCEWKTIAEKKKNNLQEKHLIINDPWDNKEQETIEQFIGNSS
tara:strand:+ start:444 stop:695 length:252 start_codon:yes stop_codon:yes gene_type:complete